MANDLPAGRELDALIAERVMGLKKDSYAVTCRNCAEAGEPYGLMPYSTDVAAAWEVVEKLDPHFSLERNGNQFSASWYKQRATCPWDFFVAARAIATTAPLAICRAALKAVSP